MPEGDTIFRAARTLHLALAGQAVTRFASDYPALTRIHEDAPLTGRVVARVYAQGKHLLIEFSGGLTLRTHMRMHGSWHIYRPGESWQLPRRDARIVVETAAFVAVGFIGAYTTYSTFAVETVLLARDGQAALGLAYAGASLVAGLASAWAGIWSAQLVVGRP